jgi:adenylate cyclase class 2
MAIEVEQKFRVADLPALERQLDVLGAKPGEDQQQVDRYYAHPGRDFATTDEALRLRRVAAHNYITYKGPKLDPTTKTRHEIELALPEGSAAASEAADLLAALSFRPVAEVHKHRRHFALDWQGRSIDIALDRIEGLGDFVELELVVDEDNVPAAQAAVAALAAQLKLAHGERRSYLELLLESQTAKGTTA